MKISDINRIDARAQKADTDWPTDSKSKDFQNQIANEKNRLKELASDRIMDEEEKEKKRKEIQQKIADLNKQFRQHQMELRREQQEQKEALAVSEEESRALAKEEEKQDEEDQPQEGLKAVISANSSFSQAKAQGNIALAMEGKVRVLQSEIRQDEIYGKDTEQKQNELKKLEQKAVKVKGAKMSYLTKAAREMNAKENRSAESANSDIKKKTDIYIRGNIFSNVEFHF